MKKKHSFSDQESQMRIPPLPPMADNPIDNSQFPQIQEPSVLQNLPDIADISTDEYIDGPAVPDYPEVPDYLQEPDYIAETLPVELDLSSHSMDYSRDAFRAGTGTSVSNDPSEDEYIAANPYYGSKPRISRSNTLYEPRQKKKTWIKPIYVVISLVIIAVLVLASYLYFSVNIKEQMTSPMTLKDQPVSNAEFSFMYHYVLIENAINIFDDNTDTILSSPGEDNFATYREYFLDMAAQQIQVTQLLYDDATGKGYQINDSQKQRAQAYIDWLSGKAAVIHVSLDTYIQGYFGRYVTEDLIFKVLSKKYFAEDYANGPKLDELKAMDTQAEEAYTENPYMYDQVSYRVLRIVFEQKEDSFKTTAHLRAQEIIDGIGHDETKFETVAASFFTGEAKDKILQPNSTLISNVRYANVDDLEWRAWLFDAARQPGDCTIFDDSDGFPILICFSVRTRQLEPLRDIRFLYINRENTVTGQAGIPDSEILPAAQIILDSITDESSMQSLETTYADEIAADKMRAAHNSDTYMGVLETNLDTWIFDKARVPGDKTMVETETQVIIAYYVGASAHPEWFDRVNSFIRMKNYQAFLLEKQLDYPYSLNPDGLQYIKDVP